MRWVLPFAFVLGACAVVAGLDDQYAWRDAAGDASVTVDAAGSDGGAVDSAGGDAADAGASDGGINICDYTEYFSFEGTPTGTSGATPLNAPDAHAYDPGKYGSCGQLGHLNQDPTYLQYGEGSRYPQAHGTVSIWFKPDNWGACIGGRGIFGSGAPTAGPSALCAQGTGVTVSAPGATITASASFDDNAWNHLVVGYQENAESPTRVLFNGALTESSGLYNPTGSVTFTLGDQATPPDACYDEVAIWDRVLSVDEMKALYDLTVPLSAACK